MKKLITMAGFLFMLTGVNAFADTDCWTDLQGNIHCTTRSDGDITPRGAY